MHFDKAFFRGLPRTRGALRGQIKRALSAHAASGREHGFHVGAGGIDRKLTGGGQKSIRWPTRISVGTATRGGTLHHTHPKGHATLSPGDLRSVVTAQNPKGGRNTLWAHSPDGHSAARLTRRAADRPVATRQKLFARAVREEKRSGGGYKPGDDDSATAFGVRLNRRLKRYGLIHSASRVGKALITGVYKAKFRIQSPIRRLGRRALPIREPRPSDVADRSMAASLLEAARMKIKAGKATLRRRRKKPPTEE